MEPATDQAPASLRTERSRPVRAVFVVLGTVFLCLAALGVVIPVLPTTPFVLLAAACYLRASKRLHDRLLRSRTFGPTIAAWQEHGAIPPRAKGVAIVMVTATFVISIAFVADSLLVRAGLAIAGAILVAWLWSRPSWIPPAGPGAAVAPDGAAGASADTPRGE